MTDDNRKSQRENTGAILRSAIRDSRTCSVQARIRITRIERSMDLLYRQKSSAFDAKEVCKIELKLQQSRQLREQVLRSLVSAEMHLQMLLKIDRDGSCAHQMAPRPAPNKKPSVTSS